MVLKVLRLYSTAFESGCLVTNTYTQRREGDGDGMCVRVASLLQYWCIVKLRRWMNKDLSGHVQWYVSLRTIFAIHKICMGYQSFQYHYVATFSQSTVPKLRVCMSVCGVVLSYQWRVVSLHKTLLWGGQRQEHECTAWHVGSSGCMHIRIALMRIESIQLNALCVWILCNCDQNVHWSRLVWSSAQMCLEFSDATGQNFSNMTQ